MTLNRRKVIASSAALALGLAAATGVQAQAPAWPSKPIRLIVPYPPGGSSDIIGRSISQALMGGFAASRILEVHGERMIKRTFNPGFRIGLHQKDLGLALAGAKSMGVALPQTASAAQLMQTCAAQGWDQLDHSALVKSLELMANHQVAPD